MILTPAPLQRPAAQAGVLAALRGTLPAPARSAAATRPVLQTARVPQQLCLDLRLR
ncbi:MAG: hypothetical protein KF720_09835 [Rubrivivax sp.]|nr:hypothetical protein [Rubrivivax sp.]